MDNRIRKHDTTVPHGPASAGLWATTTNALKYNPDGTARDVGPIVVTLPNLAAAGAVSHWALVAPCNLELIDVKATWTTGSTSGTVKVVKASSGTAIGSGTDMSSTCTLAGTANTPVSGAASTTAANRRATAGQQIGFVFAGTVTNLAGATITARFRQI